jgi:transposase
VPNAHCATRRKDLVAVVFVCDRDSASPCLAKDHDKLIVAYCWAHVRRDFLKAARRWPELARWMCAWVADMRARSCLNQARLEGWDETVPRDQPSAAFAERHGDLATHVSPMPARCEAYLLDPDLHRVQRKVLSRLHNHCDGLTVFVERPAVARDKHTAERILRTPVVGRKNYDGSGRVWRAPLAAMMVRVGQTVLRWGLPPHHWLSAFFHACADHGGIGPPDLRTFLPWQMTPERREARTRPVPVLLSPLPAQAQEGDETAVGNTS